ncbi:MAG TPA: hypothetical protein VIL42_03960 [Sphingomicrobium sp.]|jgi:hypothetical protein
MKVIVVVPSAEYKNNAGARIRYARVAECLGSHGVTLALESISFFDARDADCDVAIISKCHDARSLVAAHVLASRGIAVGVDLFDDYFSQADDSRLVRYRLWLKQLLAIVDLAMCSTPALAEVVRSYRGDLPVHLLSDPAPPFSAERVAERLDQKLSEARATGRARVLWFGVGDNPNFPVGLSDVAAFARPLAELRSVLGAIELTILTNERSLTADGLARIRQLPVAATVELWTEEKEQALLDAALLSFLPVNAQSFSTAKSLNRAITALSAGTQVLSAGYPLYAALDRFLYRDAAVFASDFRQKSLRLSRTSLPELVGKLEEIASPGKEAEALAAFLQSRNGAGEAREGSVPAYLVHGRATNSAAHDLVQATGGLSFSTPFTTASLDFDASFRVGGGGELILIVSDKALSRVRDDRKAAAVRFGSLGGRNFWHVPEAAGEAQGHEWANPSLPFQLALYPATMARIAERIADVFQPGQVIVSETSLLPFAAGC